MVSVKSIARKIDFEGFCIAESTVYLFDIILNFIFTPLHFAFEKNFSHEKNERLFGMFGFGSLQTYSRSFSVKILKRSEYGKVKLNGLQPPA